VTHHIKLGITGKSHLECLELYTPAYSLHPKLHFDTNLIFVLLLVPEILVHFFCPSGKFFPEKMKDLCQDFHYFTITFATKSARIFPMVIGCPFTSSWIVEMRSSFSYLGQNQTNSDFSVQLCNFSKVCSAT
jgi:hypothetical protein